MELFNEDTQVDNELKVEDDEENNEVILFTMVIL